MKKAPVLTALIVLTLALTACGSVSTNGSSSGGGSTRALNPEAKLALGTIKLEGTKQAVDPKTAAKLIPLWQLMVQLNSSSSSAPQEVTAVLDQIKATMTADQVNTIQGMSLSQADLFTEFQQAQAGGADPAGGTTGAGGRNNRGGGFFFAGGPGGGFGGGFGGGGFGGVGARNNANGTSGSTSQVTAAEAAQAAQARQNAISDLVINQLIRLLQTKMTS